MFHMFSNMFSGGFPGMPSFVNENREYINASGIVNIRNTTVSQQARVSGNLKCDHSNLNELSVTGTATISDTTINNADFVGLLDARNCTFNNPIQITSNEARVVDSQLRGVVVRNQTPPVDQILVLSGETRVEGNIAFASGHGTVLLEGNATINGQVIGGNIERRPGNIFGF